MRWFPKKRWIRVILVLALSAVAGSAWFVWWSSPGRYAFDHDLELPARFSGGLIYAEPVTVDGERLSLLADTGGGLFVTEQCASRCGMRPAPLPGVRRARLPAFQAAAWIPEPTGGERWIPLVSGEGDGMLGQRWFAGGIWTLDYPGQRLILRRAPLSPSADMVSHAAPLGFRHTAGMRTANHPRLVVKVAGEELASLFDTGATVWLSPEALRAVGDRGPAERATSFVSAARFRRWREAHPEWRVIEKGCTRSGEDLIEVPEVEVAGVAVGPVWFTRRADGNYTWMSSYTDGPIEASIGGSLLRYFRVTLDYEVAVSYFECQEPTRP